MLSNNVVFTKPLHRGCSITCLIFPEKKTQKQNNNNFCFIRNLSSILHANERPEEETSNLSDANLRNMQDVTPSKDQDAFTNDNPTVKNLNKTNTLLETLIS